MDTYRTNEHFREIVDKYCVTHGVTVEEALKHAIIKQIEEQNKEKKR